MKGWLQCLSWQLIHVSVHFVEQIPSLCELRLSHLRLIMKHLNFNCNKRCGYSMHHLPSWISSTGMSTFECVKITIIAGALCLFPQRHGIIKTSMQSWLLGWKQFYKYFYRAHTNHTHLREWHASVTGPIFIAWNRKKIDNSGYIWGTD